MLDTFTLFRPQNAGLLMFSPQNAIGLIFQIVIAIFIIIFIAFPINPPLMTIAFLNSIFGIIVATIIAFLLFIYTPLLGILFIIAYYVAWIRSNKKIARITQTQENTNFELKEMATAVANDVGTLEEQIVNIMSPVVPKKAPMQYYYSKYKPVNESIGSASML